MSQGINGSEYKIDAVQLAERSDKQMTQVAREFGEHTAGLTARRRHRANSAKNLCRHFFTLPTLYTPSGTQKMSIKETPTPKYWNYFLALEADVSQLSRFIEFSSENFQTYSMEMAKILLSVSSEVDVIAKHTCKAFGATTRTSNMLQYRAFITGRLEGFSSTKVQIPRFGLELTPWINWEDNKNPNWWTDHNAVKHQRHDSYKLANLENVLNSMAGLFVLIYYYNNKSNHGERLLPEPNMFYMREMEMMGLDY